MDRGACVVELGVKERVRGEGGRYEKVDMRVLVWVFVGSSTSRRPDKKPW